MDKFLPALMVIVILICMLIVFLNTYRVRRTMKKMNEMLEAAINNCFKENTYDESRLSQLESKLYRFLTSSSISHCSIETEKERIKSLISDISHQTKTPIANILLYTQLLQEQEALPEACRPLTEQIGCQTEKLNFLIQALIKTSRLESGIVQVITKHNNIAGMLEAVLQQCHEKAQKKQIKLQLHASVSQELTARFDLKWTVEALYNILDNAVKYTPLGGEVTLSVAEYELFCCIRVADTGIGISEEEQAKIFGRFYRSPTVSEQEGVGIGLFLAREILAAESGYIKVASTLGKGSTFSVFLPKS